MSAEDHHFQVAREAQLDAAVTGGFYEYNKQTEHQLSTLDARFSST
jgi:hypothetical protein